ncbi:HD domain-containing protein [Psychrobacter celer]|uniref:HD domain-containing protein n=3 Tax=Psychrobacter celer TaxID=306572 RepID=UPI003FD12758
MSTQLIKHLENKAIEDSNTSILLAQWSFDEKLVSKSLENIAGYFPHFSSHNSSHSKQILINIERLLGKNLKLLSATDTWLILESAYWHDIGMLFDAKEAVAVTESDEFKEFVESLANDRSTDLNEFASNYSKKGWKIALSNYEHPQIGIEQYRQMIAEWFRRHHQVNSQKIVRDPFNELGISSPRTELFPNRIYTYLGQICLAHGTSFQRVMTELPFRQTGLGTENCHPRFVACLLRLGDIFDIDDNRFCPVMAKQVYDTPSLSQAHFDKHKSIREFQLDNQTVSITAECNNESAYIETQLWFGWIKEELQDQMSQWKNIVPHRNFGLLPTVEKLTVEMTTTKKLINDKPMKFSIDEKNAIELLQGKNLYDDKTNIFRELIQNAVDATLLRAWIEHGEISETRTIQSYMHPFHETVQKILSKYPIEVDLAKLSDCEDSQFSIWEFSVLDKGLGISLQDLQYMQQIAGSSRNIEKHRIIKTMPLWMRPSGEFGIGMHSAFLLMEGLPDVDKKIALETKSKKDNKIYKIELTSPLTKQNGFCFIEELPDDMSRDYGTKLNVKVSLSKHSYHLNDFGFEVHDRFDRLKGSVFDYVNAHYYMEKISNLIISRTPAVVVLNKRWNELENYNKFTDSRIWDSNKNIYIDIQLPLMNIALTDLHVRMQGLFRGQKVNHMNINFVPGTIDFYGFSAKEALQIDRNKWQEQFSQKLIDEHYFKSLFEDLVNNNPIIVEKDFKDTKVISAYNRMFGFEAKKYENDNSWKNLKFFNDNKAILGKKLLKKKYFRKIT